MPKNVKGRSALLNLPGFESTAAVVAVFVPGDSWQQICISDCDRKVTLSINTQGEDDFENSMYKMDTLIGALTEFRKALKAEGKRKGYV